MAQNFNSLNNKIIKFDPFAGPEIVCVVPSTEPQREIWIACLLGSDDASRSYNESVSLRFKGALDRVAMEQAVLALVRQHDALRSTFSADGQYLCIYNELIIDFLYQDYSKEAASNKEGLVQKYVRQDILHLFNLAQGPLFKTSLLKLTDDEYCLIVTAHHIICDGWSMGILLQDISTFYSAYVQNNVPVLPEAMPFSRYADEQIQFYKTERYQQIVEFWVNQYKDQIPVLELPTDFSRPPLRTYKSNRLDYPIDGELVVAIKKMGSEAGCSFVTTLIAAFEVLLHQLTGQEVVTVGLPTAGQSLCSNQRLIGHCVHLLPLRSHITEKLSFLDFLKLCKESILDAYEHQQLTFGSLLKQMVIPRNASRIPLIPVVFNIDMGIDNDVDFHALTYQLGINPREYENFELFINVSGSGESITLEWSYNTQLFKAETIDRMMAEFNSLLKIVVANPAALLNDVKLKPKRKPEERLPQGNDTNAEYPRHTPLHALITQSAIKYPDKIALVFNNQEVSYRALNESANQLAHYLIHKGVRLGEVVGVAVERSPEMLISLLAVMKAGAAYLPIDLEYPQERITFMLDDSSTKMLITSQKQHNRLDSHVTKILIENALLESKIYSKQEPDRLVSGDDLSYVLYTSGSTGKPKGVLIEHRNLVNFIWSMKEVPGISKDDVLLAVTTISFDIAGLELYLPLVAGATILIADATTGKDGYALLALIESKKVSMMQATPSTWRMMLDSGWNKPLPLKVLCGGEALSNDLAEKLSSRCNELWNVYGPTETTIWSTIKQVNGNEELTVGTPINNTQVYILNEFLKPVTKGTVGEIYIAGDGVARGYLNREELTKEKFLENPFDNSPRSVMFRTGDLGRFLENGEIQCLGRVDHQVKIRGHRIELGEIENALNSAETIKEAVVVAREDRPGDQQLVAYVVSNFTYTDNNVFNGKEKRDSMCDMGVIHVKSNLTVTQEQVQEWKQHIRLQLPDYMVPASFVTLAKLPLTPNGKIDRKALPEPTSDKTESSSGYVAPRTDAEKLVATVWMECLKIEKVSVFDNFFELGGHSLIAVQVMNRLEKETGVRLPLSSLFEYSTVEKLSLMLQMDNKSITWGPLVPIKPQGTKIPLYIVHGEGLHVLLFNVLAKNMDTDQPIYGLQAKGIDDMDEPLCSIEEIAAYYIDAIMKKNPNGPYALAGYSFGGIIAYEMSKQLINLGKEVKLLALFDTHANQSDRIDSWPSKVWNTMRLSVKRYLYTFVLLNKDFHGTINYKKGSIKRRATYLYNKIKYRKDYYKALHGDNYKVYQSNDIADRNYRLVPQQMTIDLFCAEQRMYYMDDFEHLGWKPFALKGINIHKIPGDHATMFTTPNDKEFARILQKVLDDCL